MARTVQLWRETAPPAPMLATPTDLDAINLASSSLIYEQKFDGIRAIAVVEPAAPTPRVQVLSRNGNDKTRQFPEIVRALRTLGTRTFPAPDLIVIAESEDEAIRLARIGDGADAARCTAHGVEIQTLSRDGLHVPGRPRNGHRHLPGPQLPRGSPPRLEPPPQVERHLCGPHHRRRPGEPRHRTSRNVGP